MLLSCAVNGARCPDMRCLQEDRSQEVFKWKAKFCGASPLPVWHGPLSQPPVSTHPARPARHQPLPQTKPRPCVRRTTPSSRLKPDQSQSAHWERTRPCRFGKALGALTIDLKTLRGSTTLMAGGPLSHQVAWLATPLNGYIFDSLSRTPIKGWSHFLLVGLDAWHSGTACRTGRASAPTVHRPPGRR